MYGHASLRTSPGRRDRRRARERAPAWAGSRAWRSSASSCPAPSTPAQLTGVGNRRDFDQTLRAELERRAGRRDADASPLALLIVDLDDFKSVNDGHGHGVGDAVLREAASSIRAVLRSDDRLARIGGDEFAVIAPGANESGARILAEAIQVALAADAGESGMPAPLAAVGWSVFPLDGEGYESLMQAADGRMMRRKRNAQRLASDARVVG